MSVIVFFPIILLFVLVTIYFMKKRVFGNFWLISGYAAVLLFSVGLSFLVIEEKSEGTAWSYEEGEQAGIELFENASAGNEEAIPTAYMDKKWKFHYEKDQLTIETLDNRVNGIQIFLERKEENDQEIDAIFFQTPSSIVGKLANSISIPAVQQTESTLQITNVKRTQLDYSAFKKEFPFRQATDEKGFFESSAISLGRTLLYLRVPKDLELKMDANQITEVNNK